MSSSGGHISRMPTIRDAVGARALRVVSRTTQSGVRSARTLLTTTPGLMVLLCSLLSAAILAAGISMTVSSERKQAALDVLVSETEPTSYAAHQLYTELSVADTAATIGFVHIGTDSAPLREQYLTAISGAETALAEISVRVDATNSQEMSLLTTLYTTIPVYTGIVDTARANNRAGLPVGTAYIGQASELMTAQLLPAAAELFDIASTNTSTQQAALTKPQWVPLSGVLAALLLLVLGQLWLTARVRRRFNRGFVAATLLMTLSFCWISGGNWITWRTGKEGFTDAFSPMSTLTSVSTAAHQARTRETLALVQRLNVSEEVADFPEILNSISTTLNEFRTSPLSSAPGATTAVEQADNALKAWSNNHDALLLAQARGNYTSALEIATGEEANSVFESLVRSLQTLIDISRDSMHHYLNSGLRAARYLWVMALIPSLLAVVCVWLGIRRRLQEYL